MSEQNLQEMYLRNTSKRRVYSPCSHVLEIYPETRRCEKPAKIVSGRSPRCPEHPVVAVWPA